jgi:hypothetical protein
MFALSRDWCHTPTPSSLFGLMTSLEVGARIFLRRARRFSGSAIPWTVRVDGQKVGRIKNGGTLDVPVAVGPHCVELTARVPVILRSKPFDVTVKAGDVVRLTCRLNALTNRLIIDGEQHDARRTYDSGSGRADMAAADQSRPNPITDVNLIEASRREVALGDETRVIDNSRSSSPTVRTMRLTKEWTKSYTLDMERATTVKGSAALTVLAALKAEAERTVTRQYSASTEDRRSFEEEVTLTIGAGIRSEVVFSWKEIRQSGTIMLASGGTVVEIPFEVVVGVTFDQRQVDASTAPAP